MVHFRAQKSSIWIVIPNFDGVSFWLSLIDGSLVDLSFFDAFLEGEIGGGVDVISEQKLNRL